MEGFMRVQSLLLLLCLALSVTGCAGNPKDRGPWHQWLHEKGLE